MAGASKKISVNYVPLYTATKFHNDDSRVRCILGPVGSGKSVACIMECALLRAMAQAPDVNGIRRTRGVMIRATYNELESTTLKTFDRWFPEGPLCTHKQSPVLMRTVHFGPLADGTFVECEVIFKAVPDGEVAEQLRSLDLTWAYINEASEIKDYKVISILQQRIGRFPEQDTDESGVGTGGPTWKGIVIDTNAPDDEHWVFRVFEQERPEGYKIFHQPPAVVMKPGCDPQNPVWELNVGQVPGIMPAENIEHLGEKGKGGEYYMGQIPGMSIDDIKVNLCGEYGVIKRGCAVFPEYKSEIHYAPNNIDPETKEPLILKPMMGLPIVLGFDFGLRNAACTFAQLTPQGQLRAIDELPVEQISTREFGYLVKTKLVNEYPGLRVLAFGDPAGLQRKSTDAKTDIEILNACGIPVVPCPTNNFKERREACVWFMTRMVDGQPGLLVGNKCAMLHRALMGKYCYEKISTANRGNYFKDSPIKNEFSHPADSFQYICASLLRNDGNSSEAMRVQDPFSLGQTTVPIRNIKVGVSTSGFYV